MAESRFIALAPRIASRGTFVEQLQCRRAKNLPKKLRGTKKISDPKKDFKSPYSPLWRVIFSPFFDEDRLDNERRQISQLRKSLFLNDISQLATPNKSHIEFINRMANTPQMLHR